MDEVKTEEKKEVWENSKEEDEVISIEKKPKEIKNREDDIKDLLLSISTEKEEFIKKEMNLSKDEFAKLTKEQ